MSIQRPDVIKQSERAPIPKSGSRERPMKKIVLLTLAALVGTGSIFTSYGSASAQDYRYRPHLDRRTPAPLPDGEHHNDKKGAAIVGGLAAGIIGGLVARALLKDKNHPRRDGAAGYRHDSGQRSEGSAGSRRYGGSGYRYNGGQVQEGSSGYRNFGGSGYRYNSGQVRDGSSGYRDFGGSGYRYNSGSR